MLTPQFILRVAGIAALVIAALFAVLAVHYYLTQNIRAVMDDLSGKARAQGVAGTRRRAAGERRGSTRRGSRDTAPVAVRREEAGVQEAPAPTSAPAQAEVAAPQAPAPAFAFYADEDGSGTVLVAVGAVGATSAEPTGEDDLATEVVPEAAPPQTDHFCVTRRVVHIHSDEIIAASEELSL